MSTLDNKKLTNYYYKGKTKKYHGLDDFYESKTWWFTGNSSFMSNWYVIYRKGLADYDPNPTAVLQGLEYDKRMFDIKSTNSRASFGQFISYLQDIIDKQAAIEEKYLRLKLDQLKKEGIIKPEYLNQIESFINSEPKDYSSAYTLLLRRDKDLEKLREDTKSKRFKSFSKTNEFWGNSFTKFIEEKLTQQIQAQQGSSILHINLEDDFSNIVEEFLNKTLGDKSIESESISFIKKTFEEGLKESLAQFTTLSFDVPLKETEQALERVSAKKLKANQFLTTKGKFRTPGSIARKLSQQIAGSIGRGLSQEVFNVGSLQKIGAKGVLTGDLKKQLINSITGEKLATVSQKADALAFEVYNADIDIGRIVEEVYSNNTSKMGEDFLKEVERRVNEALQETSAGEMFEISENIKGYTSNYNLQIEGSGSFYNRMSNIYKLKLDGNMVNKLIFMLNNTTKGCIADNRVSEIGDYFAAIVVAWMFDDYEEIFNITNKEPNQRINRIHLFGSGSAYFTASQILQQTLNNLKDVDNPNRFANVHITPAEPFPDERYEAMRHEVPYEQFSAMSKEQQQEELKREWDIVKDYTMRNGTLSVDFNQKQLDELLFGLRSILLK